MFFKARAQNVIAILRTNFFWFQTFLTMIFQDKMVVWIELRMAKIPDIASIIPSNEGFDSNFLMHVHWWKTAFVFKRTCFLSSFTRPSGCTFIEMFWLISFLSASTVQQPSLISESNWNINQFGRHIGSLSTLSSNLQVSTTKEIFYSIDCRFTPDLGCRRAVEVLLLHS